MTQDPPAAVLAARVRFGERLMAHPDVHGIGVGLRRTGGAKTDEFAIVVHVEHKVPEGELEPDRLVPRELVVEDAAGRRVVVRTDVQQRGRPTPEAAVERVRPVPGGVSAGFSGTLGAWVWDTVTGQAVALSNRHVFGHLPGTAIVQPCGEDGGVRPADQIASVVRAGTLDASIAAPALSQDVSPRVLGSGAESFRVVDATVGMRVQKAGRATGVTVGTVDLIDYDSDHFGSHADLWIDGEDGDFSDLGDSGAVYLAEGTDAMVGLHWGGSDLDGVGHPIRAVFADLGLTTLPAAGAAPARSPRR